MNLPTQNVTTMSSLDLVNMINSERMEKAAGGHMTILQHKNFLAKVPTVLGADQSAIFLADYKDDKNRIQKCYQFPKREACLMAMSYSYDLQAKVFDKMTELESAFETRAALPDFSDPQVITGLLTTLQDAQGEVKRLNRVCNDLASQLASGITPPQFAKLLNGVNSQQIQRSLIVSGHLKNTNGGALRGIRVTSKGRTTGYFAQNWTDKGDFKVGSALVTEKGAKWIYKQYQNGKLPMLQGWDGRYERDLFLSDKPQLALVPTVAKGA